MKDEAWYFLYLICIAMAGMGVGVASMSNQPILIALCSGTLVFTLMLWKYIRRDFEEDIQVKV